MARTNEGNGGGGGGVSSVNGLTGAVILAAGPNITLTPVGNTITIAASGGGGGTPSLPLTSVQYNTAGAFDGDALFIRDAVTNYTDILKDFSVSEEGGFKITPDVGGGNFGVNLVPGSFAISEDTVKNLYALSGAGDVSGILGGATGLATNSTIMAVYNPVTNDSARSVVWYYDGSIGGTASMRHETDVTNGVFNSSFVVDEGGVSASAEDTTTQQIAGLSLQNSGSAQLLVVDNITNATSGILAGFTGVNMYTRPVFTGTKDWQLAMIDNVFSDQVSLSYTNITDNNRFLLVDPNAADYMFGDIDASNAGNYLHIDEGGGPGGLTNLWTTNLHVQSPNLLNAPLIYIDSSIKHMRIGYNAGGNSSLLAGAENVYVGYEAGFGGGGGGSLAQANVAVGFRAGYSLSTTGDENTLIGWMTGDNITTGQNNTIVGARAGDLLTTQNENALFGVIVGDQLLSSANSMFGTFSGGLTTTGDNLAFFGRGAGLTNVTGSSLVLIGSGADVSAGGFNASIGIGRSVSITGSNQLKFGSNTYPIYEAYIGDYTNAQNNTYISVNDNTQIINNVTDLGWIISDTATNTIVDINTNFDTAIIGGSAWNSRLSIDGSGAIALLGDYANVLNGIHLAINNTLQTVSLGDVNGSNFNTKITIDDTTGGRNIQLNATNLTQVNSNRILLNGSVQFKRTAVNNADYVIPATDYLISMENLSASRTVTVPDASTIFAGRTFIIKDADGLAATWNIVLDPAGTDTIDGAATMTMATNYQSVTLMSDGVSNWEVV